MKIKNIFTILALAIGACGITSCEDFLDTMPDQRAELNSVKKVKDLLVSAYPKGSELVMEEMMSDNRMDNTDKYGQPSTLHKELYFWEDVTEIGQDTPYFLWNECYSAIAAANQALEAIKNLGNPSEAIPYKGEALMCRAFSHFILANMFCMAYGTDASIDLGIPYMMKPETTIGEVYERGTLQETYEKIDADIEAALPLLSGEAYEVPLYHFTPKAAYAFAAQFNLFYNKFDKVVEYATKAIGEDPTSVLRNMNGYAQFPTSKEYTLAYVDKDEPANLLLTPRLSWWGYGGYTSQRYGHSRTICEEQTIWSEAPWIATSAYESVMGYGDASIFVPKLEYFTEIANAITGSFYGWNVTFAFTTDKTLLNRAEAHVLAKEYDLAVQDLQYWLKKRGAKKIPTKEEFNAFYETAEPDKNGKPLNPKFDFALEEGLQTNLLKAVIHIRRIETVHEGERWQDIKRFGMEVTHNVDKWEPVVLASHDLRKAMQLPAAVLEAGMQPNSR